jgi:AbiV family abortive infection protein
VHCIFVHSCLNRPSLFYFFGEEMSSSVVTPQYLLEGAVYALEQCGLLLRDAALLYRSESYASAVALAAFAREELGRWKILLSLRSKVLGGECLTIDEIKTQCEDHVTKQRAGMLSLTMRASDRESGVGKLLWSRIHAPPGSKEWSEIDDKLAKIDRGKKKRVPGDRHEQRMSALYVDPVSIGLWNRPSLAITLMSAYEFLNDARNDYSIQQCDRYTNLEMVNAIDPELGAALEQWPDRPQLPFAEILAYPAS